MSNDVHDIEWRCGCGHTNPDFDEKCNGCGQERYPKDLCLICGEFVRECVCTEETKAHHTEYRTAVESLLTTGRTATRDQRPGPFRNDDWPLSEEEIEELEEARVLGVSVADFARRLEERDINSFERSYEQQQSDDCCRDFASEFRDRQVEAQALKR